MLRVMNPATETCIRELAVDTPSSIFAKFQNAKNAQPAWTKTNIQDRIKIIQKFKEILSYRKEELAHQLTQEMGKPISQARQEIQGVLPRLDFFMANVEKVIAPEMVHQNSANRLDERITHEALGVIANISAWNYPYFVGTNVFIPALLTGNAVLYKPSEFASLTGLSIQEMLHEAGVPKDIFSTVIGNGYSGMELLKHPIQGVFFTGSYSTGRKIAEAVSSRMIKTQFELGGKDPIYICEDVDIAAAAASTADGAFYNAGQGCCSVERLYIHEKIYDAFIESFMNNVQSFSVGNPLENSTYLGPLTRPAQLEFLENQVQDALQKGAKLLKGGKRIQGAGYFFEPTVLTQVNHTMSVMREESFGPMIGIQKVGNDQEAIQLMNDTDYGLTAGVYTQDPERARKILTEIHSGTVYWNCCDRVSPHLPWSGRGHSGLGSTLSTYGIQTFVQPKAWHSKAISPV